MKQPHIIDPRAVYDLEAAALSLGLKKNCLPREVRLRRLRVAKRAGKYFTTGQWLTEWLHAGEVRRRRREEFNGVAARE